MEKIYVIRDKEQNDIVGITEDKNVLKMFLEKRDPTIYDWVKITNKEHIELTKRRYSDCSLTAYGEYVLTQLELECVQDKLMELPPFLIHETEILADTIKYLKMTEEESSDVMEAIAIIYSLFRTIEEPPAYLDGVIDETMLIDEYLLVKKCFIEEFL